MYFKVKIIYLFKNKMLNNVTTVFTLFFKVFNNLTIEGILIYLLIYI